MRLDPGAVLEIVALPGTEVRVEATISTPFGRHFTDTAEVQAGSDGLARVRVPYADRSHSPVRAEAPYRIRVDDTEQLRSVSDKDVREGAILRVPQAAPDETEHPATAR